MFTLAIAPMAGAQSGVPATAVTVDAVRRESVQEHRRVTGELRAVRRSSVATQEEGVVVDMPVTEGRKVTVGEVLAVLDSRRIEIELRQADAEVLAVQGILEERQARQSWREEELDLYRKSAQRGAANVKELLDAEALARIAAAITRQGERRLEVTKARAELLRKRLEDMTIVAPFDGVVVQKHAELGEWVGEGDAVVELVSTGLIDAWLDIPQRYFAALRDGTPEISIDVEAMGGSINVGEMRVVTQVDPKARSFSCVATIDNEAAGGRLAPGMSLTAWIPTGRTAKRLLVSRNAILRNEAGAFLYVARQPPGAARGEAASAVPLRVTVSFGVGDRVVVQGPGLAEGDLVVVEGNERLFPMMPVIPIPAEDDRAPAEEPGGET